MRKLNVRSDSFGIHYNYETYGLTSEGRAANLRKIKEANERLDTVEEFTAMKAKVQNNNFEAEIAILEDELRAGLKEVVDKEKELAVQEKIIAENKKALVGAKAKAKKEAENKAYELKKDIQQLNDKNGRNSKILPALIAVNGK